MRRVLAAAVLALSPGFAAAQNAAPYLATVIDADVLVRTGPSDKFPDSGSLKRGVPVIVDHEEFGWLAIEAPKNSLSWVPIAFVEFDVSRPLPQNAMVTEDVTLASGKVGFAQPLAEIRKAKVPAGTTLKIVGPKATYDGKQWYPVEPVYGDFRYIPKSSVKAGEPARTAFIVTDTPPPGLTPIGATAPKAETTTTVPAAVGAKTAVNHELWQKAEAAEREGKPDDAEKFYFQLARLMNEPGGDHDVANLCYTRIHAIREKKRSSLVPPAGVPSTTPVNATTPRTEVPSRPERPDRPQLLPPTKNEPTANGDKGQWSGAGRLVVAAVQLEGKTTYALETAPGINQVYVVAAPGVDLTPYKLRKVKVLGTTHTHPNATKPYILATEVAESP